MARRTRLLLGIAALAIAALASFVLIPQLAGFEGSLQAMRQADLTLLSIALGCSLLAPLCSAGVYQSLTRKRLSFAATAAVQYSGLFINRILPAGSGGIGLNILYLKRSGHTTTEAAVLTGLNNTIGFLGHMSLIAIGSVLILISGERLTLPIDFDETATLAIGFGTLAAVLILRKVARRLIGSVLVQIRAAFSRLSHHPCRMIIALLLSLCLTVFNVLGFWLCCLAIDLPVSVLTAFFIYSVAVLLGSAIPTPGGLGAVEAALVGGLVASGTAAAPALSAALLYRLVSFWFGLPVGFGAFISIRRRIL